MRGGVGALLGLNPDYIFRKCMYFLLAASSLFLFLFSFFLIFYLSILHRSIQNNIGISLKK